MPHHVRIGARACRRRPPSTAYTTPQCKHHPSGTVLCTGTPSSSSSLSPSPPSSRQQRHELPGGRSRRGGQAIPHLKRGITPRLSLSAPLDLAPADERGAPAPTPTPASREAALPHRRTAAPAPSLLPGRREGGREAARTRSAGRAPKMMKFEQYKSDAKVVGRSQTSSPRLPGGGNGLLPSRG
eukprot:scaffold3886_cov399-Prasinococcus_capsulatus_cf.AAC.35